MQVPAPSSSTIALRDVGKRYATGIVALQGVTFEVRAGEFVSLLGPSGCGKSTVLRLVAGLDAPSSGHVESPAWTSATRRDTAFVFQDPTLMPWASVFDNVWLPLRLAGRTKAEAAPHVRRALASVGLGDFEAAFPAELSGGMRMRASIARALVTQPRVLLMDEPFAALDEITRQRLNDDLLAWWQSTSLAVLFVTHSVYEAVFLSQRVLVMGARPGRVVAEVIVDEPSPRTPEFRTSLRYAQACREISQALAAASVPEGVGT
ncbi:MAG: ABC transporter ATP-binding protein [Burkholderiaceae bacterium]|nr:ABC transporter ATP-binding protein [Burkholderiaceae bacterium]